MMRVPEDLKAHNGFPATNKPVKALSVSHLYQPFCPSGLIGLDLIKAIPEIIFSQNNKLSIGTTAVPQGLPLREGTQVQYQPVRSTYHGFCMSTNDLLRQRNTLAPTRS